MELSTVGGVCDNLIEELDVRSGHHFVESWLIWKQIVLFHQSGDPQQVDPSHQSYTNLTTRNRHMLAVR